MRSYSIYIHDPTLKMMFGAKKCSILWADLLLKKVIKTLIKWPDLKVPEAMILTRFTNKELPIYPCVVSSSNLSPARQRRA
jgi:hypothetical protein